MKKILIILYFSIFQTAFAQIKNGDVVPDLNFGSILNAPKKSAKLSELRGKIVLIEFWATWCGSCLSAMPHLQSLQARYPKSLQVIAVTDETIKRTAMFLKVKPSNFWFAVDTGQNIAKVFPHQLIPHTALIGADGKLIALTSPELITDKVIDSLLAKKDVHLAEKKDNLVSTDDLMSNNFAAPDTTQSRFTMQAEIKGASGMSTTWLKDKVFSGRRLTCVNLPLATLYMLANGNYPYSRTINQTKDSGQAAVYCLDIIVKSPGELLPSLQRELQKRFDLKAKLVPMDKDVQTLRIADTSKFGKLARNTSGIRTYYSRHGEIDQDAITMAEFAEYLESYGIGKLVTDETGNQEKLNIKFSFQPENPGSLLVILEEMGLKVSQEKKKVDMLVIYKSDMM